MKNSTATTPPPPSGPDASDSTDALARRACAGDRDAFDTLANQLRPRLVALLRQKLQSESDAEDVAQKALLRWWEKRDAYDPRRAFLPWLFTLTLRLATDTQRAGARRANHEANAALRPHQTHTHRNATQQLEQREQHQHIWATVRDTLGPDAATALWLFYGEGLTPTEIAPVLNKRAGAVRVMLHRGRAALRPHLHQWSPNPTTATPPANKDHDHTAYAITSHEDRHASQRSAHVPPVAGVES